MGIDRPMYDRTFSARLERHLCAAADEFFVAETGFEPGVSIDRSSGDCFVMEFRYANVGLPAARLDVVVVPQVSKVSDG